MWKKIAERLFLIIGLSNLLILFIIFPIINYDGSVTFYPKYHDALQAAMELGRLDILSALLTVLGILIAIVAIFGFGYIVSEAKTAASDVARRVTTEHLATLFPNVGGLRETSSETKSPDANRVDISEIEQEGGSDGNA